MKIEPIQAIPHIQKNIQMYLGKDDATADVLVSFLTADAYLLGVEDLLILHLGEWTVMESTQDWMTMGYTQNIEELFSSFVPFVEGGQNAFRRDILLSAFATDIVTATGPVEDNIEVVMGEASGLDLVKCFERLPSVKRLLAFRM